MTDNDVPRIVEICRRLDGIALAIEFAAARVDDLGIYTIAKQLDDLFSVLTRGRRTALQRHQTLEAMLGWSYDRLVDDERFVFRCASCFRGCFTAEAVTALMADDEGKVRETDELLSNLYLKSLLSVDVTGHAPTYRLLDTTRAFGISKAVFLSELGTLRSRHAAYVLMVLDGAEAAWGELEPVTWTERYSYMLDDLRAALEWAFAPGGDSRLGLSLTATSSALWFSLSLLDEYGRRLRAALEIAETSPTDPAVHIRLWDVLGHAIWHSQGRMSDMIDAFKRALDYARQENLEDAQLRALWGLLVGSNTDGDYAGSLAYLEQFRECSAKSSDPRANLTYRRMSALSLHYAGDHAASRVHAEYVIAISDRDGRQSRRFGLQFDQRVTARSMLARVLWLQGFADQARDCALEAIDIARTSGHALSFCFVLANAAIPIAFWTGDLAAAAKFNDELTRSAQEHALIMWSRFAQGYQAVLNGKEGAVAESDFRDVGNHLVETIATIDERYASAFALDRGEAGLAGWCTPELLRIRAKRRALDSRAEDAERAETLLLRSIDLAQRQGALAWRLRSAITLAEVMLRRQRKSEGLKVLSAVRSEFKEGHWTSDMITCSTLLQAL